MTVSSPSLFVSGLQLSAQKTCGSKDQLAFNLAVGDILSCAAGLVGDRSPTSHNVTLAQDRHGAADVMTAAIGKDGNGGCIGLVQIKAS